VTLCHLGTRTLITCVLAATGFGLLCAVYDHAPLTTLDEEVAEWMAASRPEWAEWLARPFSWVGGGIGMWPICIALVALLAVRRLPLQALWAGVTLAAIHVVFTPYLKEAFDRPRPTEESAVPLPSSDALPSGHASGSAVTFGLLAVLVAERWPERERLVWVAAGVLILATGASRIVLGVHHTTDVVAGFSLGVAWLAAALLVRPARR
jgi:membrane-associated phospholipid phosphatase